MDDLKKNKTLERQNLNCRTIYVSALSLKAEEIDHSFFLCLSHWRWEKGNPVCSVTSQSKLNEFTDMKTLFKL